MLSLTTTSLPSRMTVTVSVTAAATSLPSASADPSAAGQAAVSPVSSAVFVGGGCRGAWGTTSAVLGMAVMALLAGMC